MAASHSKPFVKKFLGDGVAVLQHKKGNNKSKNNVHFFEKLAIIVVNFTFFDSSTSYQTMILKLNVNFV